MRGLPERIGPYQLGRCLGRGGMGVVFEASRPDLPRSVALKLILPGAAKPSVLERFLREAQALARVRHPGVVRIHELAQDANGPYLVEELVPGVMLSDLCGAEGIPPDRTARLLLGMAEALVAVHAAGILHRDLKPSNVMVRPDDHPVLLDFGLARAVDAERLTVTGDLLGTPAYMAPEQAEGGSSRIDARTDVYQLGALGFHLLAGGPPYGGPIYQVLASILKGDPPAWPDSDPALIAILQRAMHRDPNSRYPSAAAFRDALAAYARGAEPEPAPPPPPPRRGKLAAGTAVFVGVAAVALGAATMNPEPPEPTPTTSRTTTRATPSSPTARPSPSRSVRPAAPEGFLWGLRAGDQLRFDTWTAEDAQETRLELNIRHRATVRPDSGGRFRWRSTVERVALEVRIAGGVATRYRSDQDEPDNPFRALRRGVGLKWTLALDPRTGGVTDVRGIPAIYDAVRTLGPVKLLRQQRTMYRRVCSRTLTNAFIERHLDSLLRLQGGEHPQWVRRGRRKLGVEVERLQVLPSPRFEELDRNPVPFEVRGESLTGRWGVLESRLTQRQLRQIRTKDGGVLRSTVEWGFKLVR